MKRMLIPLLLALSLLTGCTGAGSGAALSPISARAVADAVTPARTESAERAYSEFGLELLRQSRVEGENTLLSPLSVIMALGMTNNGAAGDTLAGFSAVFGMDLDSLNSLCAAMLADYTQLGGSTEATLVNSLWADPDLALNDSFIARCTDTFAAQLYHADLQGPTAVAQINRWVSEATQGLIPSVVDRFDDDAVLALVNALYLKNQFETPFPEPASEWTLDFTAEDGTASAPKGMGMQRELRYLSHEGGQGVALPYDDGRLGLLLMLPDQGISLTDYLAGWEGGTTAALLSSSEERLVDLTMPKFELEWDRSLKNPLSAMGLASAFDPISADFSSLGTADGPLFIGDVIHKTVLKVNEKGTEAAAVTVVSMDTGAMLEPEQPIFLRFDRPFVCGIIDLETGAPLFLGTVENLA